MTLAEQYLEGLKAAYIDNGGKEAWQKAYGYSSRRY